jgi:hypothetical protein
MRENEFLCATRIEIISSFIYDSEDFASFVLEGIYKYMLELTRESCIDCSCDKKVFLITFFRKGKKTDSFMFHIETGVFPFEFIESLYKKYSGYGNYFTIERVNRNDLIIIE